MPPQQQKSYGKYHCVACNIYIGDNKRSRIQHDQGKGHLAKINNNMTERLKALSTASTIAAPPKLVVGQADPSNRFASSLGVYGQESKDNSAQTEPQPTNTSEPITSTDDDSQSSGPSSTDPAEIQVWLDQMELFALKNKEMYKEYKVTCKENGIDFDEYLENLRKFVSAPAPIDENEGEDAEELTTKNENIEVTREQKRDRTVGDIGDEWQEVETHNPNQNMNRKQKNNKWGSNHGDGELVQLPSAANNISKPLDLATQLQLQSRAQLKENDDEEIPDIELKQKKKKRKNTNTILDFD